MPDREQRGSGVPVEPVCFVPDWAIPPGVCALQTERGEGAVGAGPYGGFNLGDHVGDDAGRVRSNRHSLRRALGIEPVWLNQVHGTSVCNLDTMPDGTPEADAAVSQRPGMACAIMTADCLPVLIADRHARVIGAAHAGWRGLAGGVLQSLLHAMTRVPGVSPRDLTVWLGPAIGPTAFEVGFEVRDVFIAQTAAHAASFMPHPERPSKLLADLPALALRILQDAGVEAITPSHLCTVSLGERFYSYRRDGVTGRMASLIWLDSRAR